MRQQCRDSIHNGIPAATPAACYRVCFQPQRLVAGRAGEPAQIVCLQGARAHPLILERVGPWGTPSPKGIFAFMSFVLFGLQRGTDCKIFISNDLPAKYCF